MRFGDESFLHTVKSWQYRPLFRLNFYFSKCYAFAFGDLVRQWEGMPHTPLFPCWIGGLKLEIAGRKLYRLDALSPSLCLSLLLWNNYCYVDKPSAGPMTSAISRVLFPWYSFQETFASDLELQQRSPAVLLCFSWSTWHMRDAEIDSFHNDLQETLTVVCVLVGPKLLFSLFLLTLFSFMYVKEGEEGENMPWCFWCNCYLELWYLESCHYGCRNPRTAGCQHPVLSLFACVFLITWCKWYKVVCGYITTQLWLHSS